MTTNRRDFIKANAAAAAAATIGVNLPVAPAAAQPGRQDIAWDKAPCRFCGVGCSVLVGTKDGRVVATQGDPDAPVNKGLNCIKGYFLSKIMYGEDRLTTPLLRMRNGKFDKEGDFAPITWKQAFDIMEEKWKAALKEKGPTAVGMFGSGQWTIWEGYAAAKLYKAGFRSNNLDPNARHCMASAVTGFMRTFGIDEPMGCYDDLEQADAFVLWGANMAEMHPILWSRLTDRRLSNNQVKVVVLSTFENRCFELADVPIVFTPQTDLAILNFIANHIIQTGKVNKEFVQRNVNFHKGVTDIGYGLRAAHPLEKDAKDAKDPNASSPISFEEYAKFVSEYTAEKVSKLSGVSVKDLKTLADVYADPKLKVVSYWTMGFNQHTRGTWVNNLVYNVHLLTGKISEPGNGPFSLTGQPSACGTAREVGTFSHRLPADMVVTNPKHREVTEQIWHLPDGTLPDKIGLHAVAQSRALKDGTLLCYWTSTTNNMQAGPNINGEVYPGWRNPKTFIVVSDPVPDRERARGRPDPAGRDVGREGGRVRQCRAPHPVLEPAGQGARRSAVRPVAVHRILEALQGRGGVAAPSSSPRSPSTRARRSTTSCSRTPFTTKYKPAGDYANDESKAFGFYVQKGLFEEYRQFGRRPRARPRRVRRLSQGARPALAGGRRQGDAVALPRRLRPVREEGRGREILRQAGRQGSRVRAPLPAGRRVAGQGLRHVAVHGPRARALAHRLDDAARGRALPRVSRCGRVHESGRRQGRAACSAA